MNIVALKHREVTTILPKDDTLPTTSQRLPSFLWQVNTLDSASADIYHPVHGTAHLTKSTHYHRQRFLLALLLNINAMVSGLENTNKYISRTSIRTGSRLACTAALPLCRSTQNLPNRWEMASISSCPVCLGTYLTPLLVKSIKCYHLCSVIPVQNIWW